MAALDWLIARPIAHRGLHDASTGCIENTRSAFVAAMNGGFGIECDLQVSADGEAMVYHDPQLGRLAEGAGRLQDIAAGELKQLALRGTADTMMTLAELCELVAGAVPLLIEIKSAGDRNEVLLWRIASVLDGYSGPAALMSFDPLILRDLRRRVPARARGVVAARHVEGMRPAEQWMLANLLHAPLTRPDFVAYDIKDLPNVATSAARTVFGRPLLAWTVRTVEERARAARYASQMIFEGFRP